MRSRAPGLLAVLLLLTACPAIARDSYVPAPPTPAVFTCDGGVSTSFDVTGDVINPQSFLNLAEPRSIDAFNYSPGLLRRWFTRPVRVSLLACYCGTC